MDGYRRPEEFEEDLFITAEYHGLVSAFETANGVVLLVLPQGNIGQQKCAFTYNDVTLLPLLH